MSVKVLIVEDDADLNRYMELDLKRHGYEVFTARDGREGLRLFHEARPSLVLLDVALPGMNGMTVCQRIRELSNVPILIMTAHAVTEEEMAEGLNLGADEYMIKPLRSLEFHARVNAIMRRAQLHSDATPKAVRYADDYLIVDVDSRRVTIDNKEIRLTPTEFKLLATFVRHKGQVLTFQ